MLLNLLVYHLKRPFHFVKTGLLKGFLSELKYQFPQRKLKILAITGTDGKTTSATMLYQVLKKSGKKVALLSTVAAYIGNEKIETGFHVTSPNPNLLIKFMRRLVDEKYEYLVIEATSHGIYQYRTWGIHPLITGVTNITHEHIDYHVTYQEYLKAKLELLKDSQLAVINDDDQSSLPLKTNLRNGRIPFLTYSHEDRLPESVETAIKKRFPEHYNQMNARLVYTMALKLEIDVQDIAKGLKDFPGVEGRMEVIQTKPFKVVVDFAHTPQALKSALTALHESLKRQPKKGRLIAVYGSAGLRDSQKRPMMGQIGTEIADYVIFTAEDPRTENVWSIIRQMKEQLTSGHQKVLTIIDRGEAINFALTKLAKPGDIVGIFGKGHEQSMCFGTTEYPWDDRQAAAKSLKKK